MFYSIVTASASEIEEGDLEKFLESVSGQELCVILVLRGVDAEVASEFRDLPHVAGVIEIPSGGISKVRNLGLEFLSTLNPEQNDIVSFPDDDCLYPDGLVARIVNEFEQSGADLLVGSYGEREAPFEQVRPLTLADAVYHSSSVAIFARWALIVQTGGFNESLGVGSGVFSYGEDNDFALRAFQKSAKAVRNVSLRVWHLEERPTYGRNPKGYLTSCWLNFRVPGVIWLIARGILGAVAQDLTGGKSTGASVRNVLSALRPPSIARARLSRRVAQKLLVS